MSNDAYYIDRGYRKNKQGFWEKTYDGADGRDPIDAMQVVKARTVRVTGGSTSRKKTSRKKTSRKKTSRKKTSRKKTSRKKTSRKMRCICK